MRSGFTRCVPALFPALLLAAAGCGAAPSEASHENLHADVSPSAAAASAGSIRALHAATARYHSTTQATRAGYQVASPCVADPTLGGMGYHWLNGALVDPVFELLRPEAVLYEPDARGNLKLVAVEYIVVDVGQPRPEFDGHPFDIGGAPLPIAHWTLHVWVHRDNPAGIFTPFNPAVSCP